MGFFDKLGKTASDAYKVTADKTGKLAKEAKLRMKMGELKSEINDVYEEIGKTVYENHIREEKQNLKKILEEQCTRNDLLSDEIKSLEKECLELKDKKKCTNCFTEMEKDAKFCPSCGEKQEEIVEEAKEVEIVEEENTETETETEVKDDENKKSKK